MSLVRCLKKVAKNVFDEDIKNMFYFWHFCGVQSIVVIIV